MPPILLLAAMSAMAGFAASGRTVAVRFGDSGRTAPVRTAITLSSPSSPPPAPPSPDDEVDRAFAMAKAMGDDVVAKEYLRLYISTLPGKTSAQLEKLIAYEESRVAYRDVQIERLTWEKNALVVEKEMLEKNVDKLTMDLAKYEAILQPCTMIEMALRAKYPSQKDAPFVATAAWAQFFATAIGDGDRDNDYADQGDEIAMTPETTARTEGVE
jgi:hypothetical protein